MTDLSASSRPYRTREARKRWVQKEGRAVSLHRLSCIAGWNDGYLPIGGQGVTLCGQAGRLHMPGIISRLAAPRCRRCCKLVGIPAGHGIPLNDESLSERERKR